MGRNDNRRSMKMRRKIRQRKLKERGARRLAALKLNKKTTPAAGAAPAKATQPVKKAAKKKPAAEE
jgi:hypothetical protein